MANEKTHLCKKPVHPGRFVWPSTVHVFQPLFLSEKVDPSDGPLGQTAPRHYTIGKEIVDLVLDRIRKLADNCTGFSTWC